MSVKKRMDGTWREENLEYISCVCRLEYFRLQKYNDYMWIYIGLNKFAGVYCTC